MIPSDRGLSGAEEMDSSVSHTCDRCRIDRVSWCVFFKIKKLGGSSIGVHNKWCDATCLASRLAEYLIFISQFRRQLSSRMVYHVKACLGAWCFNICRVRSAITCSHLLFFHISRFANSESYRRAIEDFEHALKLNPTHNNARKYLCRTLTAYGQRYVFYFFELDQYLN